MRTLLQLHHHKHTGKLLHHKHTSYRALFIVVGLAGLCMFATNQLAKADDLLVNATVPAPLPSQAATIESPASGTTVYAPEVTFSGTCPVITPAIIVALYDGSHLLGSQTCTVSGTFSIPTTLSVGTHSVTATVMNFTGQVGATSQPPVLVTYLFPTTPGVVEPAVPPASGYQTTTPSPIAASPTTGGGLDIVSGSPFIVFSPSKDAVWDGSVQGGTQPYSLQISWGDGTVVHWDNLDGRKLSFSHHYAALHPYRVTLTATDAKGHTVQQQLTAIPGTIFSTYPTINTNSTDMGPYWLPYLYGSYAILLIILTYLWWRHRAMYGRAVVYAPVVIKRSPAKRKQR